MNLTGTYRCDCQMLHTISTTERNSVCVCGRRLWEILCEQLQKTLDIMLAKV